MYAPPCSENTGESYAEIYFFGQGTQVRVSGILESVDDDEYMRIKTYIKGDG